MKTFTAKSMPEVLTLVKQAYGSNGVILHTRSYKRGGVLGLGARQVVEVTATDGRKLAEKYKRKADHSARRRSLQTNASLAEVLPRQRAQPPANPQHESSAGDLIRRTYAAARADLGAPQQPASTQDHAPPAAVATASSATASANSNHSNRNRNHNHNQNPSAHAAAPVADKPSPTAPASPAAAQQHQRARPAPAPAEPTLVTAAPGESHLAEELSAMKQLMVKMMRQHKASIPASRRKAVENSTPDLPDPLVAHYLKLIEQEVAEELAEEIVTKVGGVLTQSEFADPDKVRRAVHSEIARHLPVQTDTDALKPTDDGRPRTIALIGPTGVGKTTTIAKLAATFKLKQGKKVGLITMDTYRIAAVEQLRTYAGIIGLPLKVVNTAEQLSEALEEYKGLDAVLIDTAGRSQKASDKLGELKQVLASAQPHEVHLVLSSTVSQKVLLQTIERFSAVEADRIIFTKLDEAVTGGVLLNVAKRVGKKVSYVTTGQEVPHEIEPGCSDRLASLVMGEGGTEQDSSEQ